jgi:ferrochelatase
MHYGTPASMEDVLPYYTHIRRGRPPEPEHLQDLISRYEAIGGPSPLNEISRKQAEAIRSGLAKRGWDAMVYIGGKHAAPFIADVVKQMAADGVEEAIGIVLAPHYSSFSVAIYTKEAMEARDEVAPNMRLEVLPRWGTLPAFIQALSDRVQRAMSGFEPEETLVIFSAHSLPERVLASGDSYKDELLETSRQVAEMSKVPHWTFAFQSASHTGEPWLGPDILEVIEENAGKYKNVVACTVGFVSDHLEVLYDLGIETRDKCEELSLSFARAECINADPVVMDQLAEAGLKVVGGTGLEPVAPAVS